MNEPHVCGTKKNYLLLDNDRQFRFSRIKEIEDSFISEINDREKINNILNNYVTVLYYADETLVVLSGIGSGFPLFSFTTVIGTPVAIASACISPVFLVTNRIFKTFFKTIKMKKRLKICFIGQE